MGMPDADFPGMTTLTQAWEAIRPTPVSKGTLVEPEATDGFSPRPWFHLPPGALMMLCACAAVMIVAAFQSSVTVVRQEGFAAAIPLVANLEQPLARSTPTSATALAHHRARRRHSRQLHQLLQQNGSTPWSHGNEQETAYPVNPVNQ